nr:hypothetical protein [Tanacetum cinerariifolium]
IELLQILDAVAVEQHRAHGVGFVHEKQLSPQLAAHVQDVIREDAQAHRDKRQRLAQRLGAVDVEAAGFEVGTNLARVAGQVLEAGHQRNLARVGIYFFS